MPDSFEDEAMDYSPRSFWRELAGMLIQTKKWWLFPLLAVMLLMGLMIFLSGTAVAPFLYTLF